MNTKPARHFSIGDYRLISVRFNNVSQIGLPTKEDCIKVLEIVILRRNFTLYIGGQSFTETDEE